MRVHRRGDRWSVWRWHDGERWTPRWYGNLESPGRRTTVGFDTQDWALDVVAAGSPLDGPWTVGFKDEDELAWMVDQRFVTDEQAFHVRMVGARLLQHTRDAGWPFDAGWDAWLPDARWAAVPVPDGWERLPGED